MMDVQLEVLIPLIVLLAILLTAVIVLLCRFFVWEQRYKEYGKNSYNLSKQSGYPKIPVNVFTTSTRQVETQGQSTPTIAIESTIPKSSSKLFYANKNSRRYRRETTSSDSSDKTIETSPLSFLSAQDRESVANTSSSQQSESDRSRASSFNSDISYPQRKSFSKSKQRDRARSETYLTTDYKKDNDAQDKRAIFSKRGKRKPQRLSAVSISDSVDGQIEFSLFYDNENKCLKITVSQLLDLTLKPENFSSLLDVYDEHQQTGKLHLVRKPDGTLELSDTSNMAFLVYVTLLPNREFSRHTNVVFGTGNIVLNETFSITGYATEELSQFQLCFHALCKFGGDGEPVVLGEVKVPLKRLQVQQVLPFVANLGPPQEVLEVENYLRPSTDLGWLNVYLSYNPIGQKLIVNVVQATGLPKIGVIGHPNVSVKACLYYCNKCISKRSTVIKKKARDPVYSEKFQFDLNKDRLGDCDILFEIRHHGPMYRTIIGYVAIGLSAGGEGEKHWKELLDFVYHERSHKIVSYKPIPLL